MEVSDELMYEHEFILKYIDLMEKYIEFSKANKANNALMEKAQEFISFFQEFTDVYHHAKEEEVLVKYMQGSDVLTQSDPLSIMMSDHDKGRVYVREMNNAMMENNLDNLCEKSSAYIQHLKQHIYNEDNVLLPMAENDISDANKIKMRNEFKQIEEKINKQAIWSEYQAKYTELESFLTQNMDNS